MPTKPASVLVGSRRPWHQRARTATAQITDAVCRTYHQAGARSVPVVAIHRLAPR
ncbi:hypothetical protein GCM10027168_42520 [Streptomyces capparidis]